MVSVRETDNTFSRLYISVKELSELTSVAFLYRNVHCLYKYESSLPCRRPRAVLYSYIQYMI